MGAAKRDRKGVRGVASLAGPREGEQPRDHECDLLLVGASGAGHVQLDGGGRERVHRKTGLGAGEEDDTANMAEDEGAASVRGMEEILDGQALRVEPRDESAHTGMDRVKAFRQREARRGSENAAFDQTVTVAVGRDRSPAGSQRAGVDAQDDDLRRVGQGVLRERLCRGARGERQPDV